MNVHRIIKPAALAALLAMLVAACGGGAPSALPTATSLASGAGTASNEASAVSPGRTTQTGAATQPPAVVPPDSCTPRHIFSPAPGVPGSNYIVAKPRPQSKWGPKCTRLTAGGQCSIQFEVAWGLVEPWGIIEAQAWEARQKSPAKLRRLGVPQVGESDDLVLEYTVGRTEAVLLQVVLYGTSGAALASSDQYVYKVGCSAG